MKPTIKRFNIPRSCPLRLRLLFVAAIVSVTPLFQTGPVPPPGVGTASNAPAPADVIAAEKTVVAKAAGDKRLFEFHAENLELKSALALFAHGNKLNIVPDNDVTGQITLDVQ